MIRVFVLSLLGLVALVLVAGHLPSSAPPGATAPAAGGGAASAWGRWEGTWEGRLVVYRPDGTADQTSRVQYAFAGASATEQRFDITERRGDGATILSTGRRLADGDRLESRLTDPQGATVVLAGRRAGAAVIWHRRDERTGLEETLREEIVATPDGDLCTVDGVRIQGKDVRSLRLIEGRYRRVPRAAE